MIHLERLPRSVLALGVPLLFFAIALWVMPIADTLQFDPDEGIELAKATLYGQGYQLYDPIWNDQPPLLTLLLSGWLKLFGPQIVAARLLVLGFATVLVGSFFNTLALILGPGFALLGTVGLWLTLDFLRLSVSVMQGLPALALVMLAIYLLMRVSFPRESGSAIGSKPRTIAPILWNNLGLIASGICFGLSLQIKLYTALLLPACFLHLAAGSSLQDWQQFKARRLRSGLVWLAACALTVLVIGQLTPSLPLDQVLGTHFDGASQVSLQREPSWLLLLMFLAQDLDYTLLAGVGVYLLFKQRPSWPLLPLVWLASVWMGLAYYQPLWYHYYPLISVPVVWLATYGLTQAFSFFRQKQWYRNFHWRTLKHPTVKGIAAGFLIFAIALTPVKLAVNAYLNHQFVAESKPKLEVIRQVRALPSPTRWLFTDLPIAAFYAGLNVPPELAVFSTKRIASGSLSDAELTRILQTYRPEQVLLGRYPKVQAALEPYLSQHYVKRYEKEKMTRYVLKSLK
ncbi:ArnT family glycosyltransferase [Altericista sp. CCNU0014]|uniref:ArnT family glycosyltransferase n=1 Tax=Altericista sp. CCNU0014 TaxID=3082949 RepID=UPI00384EEC6E